MAKTKWEIAQDARDRYYQLGSGYCFDKTAKVARFKNPEHARSFKDEFPDWTVKYSVEYEVMA